MSDQQQNKPSVVDGVKSAGARIEEAFDRIDFDEELLERVVSRPLSRATWRETLYLLSTIPAGIGALLIWSIGIPLGISIVGLPLLIIVFWIFRKYAKLERRRLTIYDPTPLVVTYVKPTGRLLERGSGYLGDSQTWKDLGWMVFLSLFGTPLALLSLGAWLIAAGWIIYPLWGWSVPGDFTPIGFLLGNDVTFIESWLVIPLGFLMIIVATWACAGVALFLGMVQRVALSGAGDQQLRGRVSELERTREETLAQQSTEMSRIERDLHDGAQARLVALAMDLGMAEQKFEEDPEAAKRLVSEARDEAQRTLQELRDLVRGIGPQILRDRGLKAAVDPLAARSPIAVEVVVDLSERPSERIETAAYFVTSEALANAIKHSSAEQLRINAWQHEHWLYVRISDNGIGGADEGGAGLRGLRARVEAVDGRLVVNSPSGGPTIIDAWLPMK